MIISDHTIAKQLKHDQYIEKLCEEISPYYDDLSKNVQFYNGKRQVCEIDILAKKGKFIDCFEVKCSYRITKARRQKKKIMKHSGIDIRNMWFYCGANSEMVLL